MTLQLVLFEAFFLPHKFLEEGGVPELGLRPCDEGEVSQETEEFNGSPATRLVLTCFVLTASTRRQKTPGQPDESV